MPSAAAPLIRRRARSPGSAFPSAAPALPIVAPTAALPAARARASPAAVGSEPATGSCGTIPANMTKVIGFTSVSKKVGRNALAAGRADLGSGLPGEPDQHCGAESDQQERASAANGLFVRREERQEN